MESPWVWDGEPFEPTEDMEGFVYKITRLLDGKSYIGKKTLWRTLTRPPLKGKKRKRRSKVESDWRRYWGSNETLKREVEELGPLTFRREVLRPCYSKGEMSYYEARYQLAEDVLLSDEYYNDFVGCKIHRSHLTKLRKK